VKMRAAVLLALLLAAVEAHDADPARRAVNDKLSAAFDRLIENP